MKFALLMTWRELRASWRRLVFFTVCLSLGVGAIVTLRSAIASVNAHTNREARALNSADIVLRNTKAWSPETLTLIESIAKAPDVLERTETLEIPTMLRPVDPAKNQAKAVEVRGVERQFPLYGQLTLADGEPYSYDSLVGGGALLSPTVAAQLDLHEGERIRIGTGEFTVRGFIGTEPDSGLGAFSFGPRVIVALDDLRKTGLPEISIRRKQSILLRTTEESYEPLARSLRQALKYDLVSVRGFREAQVGLSEQLSRAADYLSLIGLAIVVLGGIGIWSVARVYIRQRWKSIAVLKCLGCSNAKAMWSYTLQMLAIGLLGSALGVALATGVLALVRRAVADGPLAKVAIGLTFDAVFQGFAVGALVALLFSAVPLLGIRDIKPNSVLRSPDPFSSGRWNLGRIVAAMLITLGLFTVAIWQAGSFRVGTVFLTGLLVATLGTAALGEAFVRAMRRVRSVASFTLRQAITGIHRPGNQTRAILVTMGLGIFFLVFCQGIQSSFGRELASRLRDDLPDFYLIDIQEDQRDGVAGLIETSIGTAPKLVPTLRGRIVALDGEQVQLENMSARDRSRLGREYTVTTRAELDEYERVLDGAWWSDGTTSEPEISIEVSLRDDFNLTVGKTMTFDFQGQRVTARIANVRFVDWSNAQFGFMVVFRPGSLDRIPMMYIGGVKGPNDAIGRGTLSRQISDSYSNVSVIDARDIIATVSRVLGSVSIAVSVIGFVVLFGGITILSGAIAMTRYIRVYETAILKALGARAGTVLRILLFEYSLIGAIAGVAGSLLGMGLAWAVCDDILSLQWRFDPMVLAVGILGSGLLAALVGTLANVNLFFLKPLTVLKSEE